MIHLLSTIPHTVTVALSGGVDSVAVTDFLARKHNVSCAFFHHGTENSDRAFEFVSKFCSDRGLALFVGVMSTECPAKTSLEEHWRNERYKFLESLDATVVTAHNLDDCVETYLWSALHGTPKVIPMYRNNIVRPFLTTRKSDFLSWCERKGLIWSEDLSNKNTKFTRNYVRHKLMPHALTVNPGLHKVVKRFVEKQQ